MGELEDAKFGLRLIADVDRRTDTTTNAEGVGPMYVHTECPDCKRLGEALAQAERHEGELGQENTRLRAALGELQAASRLARDAISEGREIDCLSILLVPEVKARAVLEGRSDA
jgi:hypothetical protein